MVAWDIFILQAGFLLFYITLIFSDSLAKNKHLGVAFLSIMAVFVQLFAYGIGFISEIFNKAPASQDKKKSPFN